MASLRKCEGVGSQCHPHLVTWILVLLVGLNQAAAEPAWNGTRNNQSHPTVLQHEFKDEQKGLSFNSSRLAYHWVITACNLRPQWARTLTYTLLHGLLHDMAPTTTSIAWCQHYDATEIPPELYNLRMSSGINVFFVPDDLRNLSPQTTYITALSVPEYLGQPHLPLLITEDDVIFTLDFNTKLSDLTKQMLRAAKGNPYLATLYSPSHRVNSVDVVLDLFKKATLAGKHTPRPCQAQGKCSRSVRAFRSPNAYSYASLGMFYSPLVAEALKKHFIQVYYDGYKTDRHSPDVLINIFCRYRFFCSRSKNCELFQAVPSMIEHTGAQSAIQSGGNRRFHTTANFPFDVAFPLVEPLPPLNLSQNAADSSKPGQPLPKDAPGTSRIRSTPSQSRQQGRSIRPRAIRLHSLL